jgi:hypothetical protein
MMMWDGLGSSQPVGRNKRSALRRFISETVVEVSLP